MIRAIESLAVFLFNKKAVEKEKLLTQIGITFDYFSFVAASVFINFGERLTILVSLLQAYWSIVPFNACTVSAFQP